MALVKFTHNRAGYREVMKSASMRADLQARADRVRATAEALLPDEPGRDPYLLADTNVGRNRAGATIIGVPMRLEVERRILGQAIDAAR
jgi:hypothetical protein